jgi:aryl-alcohol dehydrogenase-like predicted oxidoreductase
LGKSERILAVAWLISLSNVVAIPGASSVEQVEFNVAPQT